MPVATVRIAHAEPRPGRLANGEFHTNGFLVVLADDAGRRAVPLWLCGEPGEGELARLLEHEPESVPAGVPQELTVRLLRAARARVTGVDIDLTEADAGELTPEVTVARIGLAGPAGTRQLTAGLGLGLALAAGADVPVRLPDAVLDRLAVPAPGEDLLTPFLDRVPPGAQVRPVHGLPGWPVGALFARRPRYEPRNLDFADGLDRWDLNADPDYAAAVTPSGETPPGDGPAAVLSAGVPRPAGSAALLQTIYADDYRGATVRFSGEIRVDPLTEEAGLRLEIFPHWWRVGRPREDHGLTVSGPRRWTGYEVTVRIPADTDLIRFGILLTGTGRIALRHPELTVVP
jgi:hypothetical protein